MLTAKVLAELGRLARWRSLAGEEGAPLIRRHPCGSSRSVPSTTCEEFSGFFFLVFFALLRAQLNSLRAERVRGRVNVGSRAHNKMEGCRRELQIAEESRRRTACSRRTPTFTRDWTRSPASLRKHPRRASAFSRADGAAAPTWFASHHSIFHQTLASTTLRFRVSSSAGPSLLPRFRSVRHI